MLLITTKKKHFSEAFRCVHLYQGRIEKFFQFAKLNLVLSKIFKVMSKQEKVNKLLEAGSI